MNGKIYCVGGGKEATDSEDLLNQLFIKVPRVDGTPTLAEQSYVSLVSEQHSTKLQHSRKSQHIFAFSKPEYTFSWAPGEVLKTLEVIGHMILLQNPT